MCENAHEENRTATSCFPSKLKKNKVLKTNYQAFEPRIANKFCMLLFCLQNTQPHNGERAAKNNRPREECLNTGSGATDRNRKQAFTRHTRQNVQNYGENWTAAGTGGSPLTCI